MDDWSPLPDRDSAIADAVALAREKSNALEAEGARDYSRGYDDPRPGPSAWDSTRPVDPDRALWDALDVARQGEAQRPAGSYGQVQIGTLAAGPAVTQRDLLADYLAPPGSTMERSNFVRGANDLLGWTPVGAASDALDAARRSHYGEAAINALGALPMGGAGAHLAMAGVPAAKAAQEAMQVARKLNPQGFYSHAAEVAAGLPQAKGTPEQFAAMLAKAGVKPEELKWSGFSDAFAGRPSVTRDELAAHFNERLPQINETVLGGKHPELTAADQALFDTVVGRFQENRRFLPAYMQGPHNTVDMNTLLLRDVNHWQQEGVVSAAEGDAMRRKIALQQEERPQPKYATYTLPGGENYRELVMGMAPGEKTKRYVVEGQGPGTYLVDTQTGQREFAGMYGDAVRKAEARNAELAGVQPDYRSSHWGDDVTNPLVHLRMSDRTGPQGEKLLHLEELQSDWGQAGRSKGFATPLDENRIAAMQADIDASHSAWQSARDAMVAKYHVWEDAELERTLRNADKWGLTTDEVEGMKAAMLEDRNRMSRTIQGAKVRDWLQKSEPPTQQYFSDVAAAEQAARQRSEAARQALAQYKTSNADALPSAPYVTSTQGWTDLGLKRALMEAAQGGYDRLVWTPGAEQAARYDLSKQVSGVHWSPDTQMLMAYDLHGAPVINKAVAKEQLPEYIGKDAADKLLSTDPMTQPGNASPVRWHLLNGEDLRVGGEGMKSYYDKIVPTQLQKLTKRLDPVARVEPYEIGAANRRLLDDELEGLVAETPEQEAMLSAHTAFDPTRKTLHSLPITPSMREAILKGLPAYASGGAIDDALAVANQH